MPDIYQKSGYLNSPFRLFYLEDLPGREYTYHYHDFHKLLIFLNGTVSYRVEGREYDLKPGDQVLIPAGEIHCPVVHPFGRFWYFFLSEVKIRRISSAVEPLSVEAGKSENLSDSSHRQSTDLTDS